MCTLFISFFNTSGSEHLVAQTVHFVLTSLLAGFGTVVTFCAGVSGCVAFVKFCTDTAGYEAFDVFCAGAAGLSVCFLCTRFLRLVL